jgi:virginiamycin B lyase
VRHRFRLLPDGCSRARFLAAVLCGVLMLSTSFSLGSSQARAALYMGNGAGIARANLDGTVLEPAFIDASGESDGAIAVDAAHLYWADFYAGTIGRANLDGTGVEPGFIKLKEGALPSGLAVDSEYIYWSSWGTDAVGRARLDGSEVDESFVATARQPCGVAVNRTTIYWGSYVEHEIGRTNISGNAPSQLINEDAPFSCGLALDSAHLFWSGGEAGTIGRSNLDGSDAQPEFISGGHLTVSPAVEDGKLYWVDVAPGFQGIGRADLDGGDFEPLFLGGFEQSYLSGLRAPYALAADSLVVSPPLPRSPFPLATLPAPSPRSGTIMLGGLRRTRSGAVLFAVDLAGHGWLEATVRGAVASVRPEGTFKRLGVPAGRKWLRVAPTTQPGKANRCVLVAVRGGARASIVLHLRFKEPGKASTAAVRRFLLFDPHRVHKGAGAPVDCG